MLLHLYIGSQDINEPSLQLKLKVKNTDTGVVEPVSFNIASDKFRVLLNGRLIMLDTLLSYILVLRILMSHLYNVQLNIGSAVAQW